MISSPTLRVIVLLALLAGCGRHEGEPASAPQPPTNASQNIGQSVQYTARLLRNNRYGLSAIASGQVVSSVKIIAFAKDGTPTDVPQSGRQSARNCFRIIWDEYTDDMIALGESVIEVHRISEGRSIEVTMDGARLLLEAAPGKD